MLPMQIEPNPARPTPSSSGVLVLDGYGVHVGVDHGRLSVTDGIGRHRRAGHFVRAGSGLRRLVILGHSGVVSFAALQWLANVGIGFVQLDTDGRVLAASAGLGRDDPRLRRAQATAIDTPTGDDIARRLISEKVAAQADTLAAVDRLVPVASEIIATLADVGRRLHVSTSRDEIRTAEAIGAAAYWSAWSPVPQRFARRDELHLPDGWRTFGVRTSPITASPRLAVNPANAILNYLYAILEAEARLACLTIGLDPGLGVLHADQKNRDSLALDVVEPIRPVVDRYVFSMLGDRVFRASDFVETRQGVCRILEPLTHELAATALTWRGLVGSVTERVAHLLLGDTGDAQPTPISERNRSAGRRRAADPGRAAGLPRSPRTCPYCGGPLKPGRRTCDGCRPDLIAEASARLTEAGLGKLAERRAKGERPGHTAEANLSRGRNVAEQAEAARRWQSADPDALDPDDFRVKILPGLWGHSILEIARAAGIGTTYASLIRRGLRVPHPRLWQPLQAIASANTAAQTAAERPRSLG